MAVSLRLLGRPAVHHRDDWVEPPFNKGWALLLYLAFRGGWVDRDELVYLFWPDSQESRARGNLRKLLSRSLRDNPFTEDLEIESGRLRWRVDSDLTDFRAVVDDRRWDDAVALYRGPLLEGVRPRDIPEFENWLETERQALHGRWREAVLRLAAGREAGAAYGAAADLVERLCAADPYDEEALRRYLRYLHLDGQKDKALHAYQVFESRIAQELGASPETSTIRLVEVIQNDEPSPGPMRSVAHPLALPKEQDIRFCTAPDGVRLAFATAGEGPPLVKTANYLTHLELDWHSPVWRHWMDLLSRDHRLIRYDERGSGLSDWNVDDISFEVWVRDLETVVDTLALERFPLLGISQGAPVAIAYAARHPERVSHLILHGGYARGRLNRDLTPEEREEEQTILTMIRIGWGNDNPAFRQFFATQLIPNASREQLDWFDDLQRQSATAENAERLEREMHNIDVRHLASSVRAPTLILHSRGDGTIPFEEGRILASLITGARFVPLNSNNHLLLEGESAWQDFVTAFRTFLHTPTPHPPDRSPSSSATCAAEVAPRSSVNAGTRPCGSQRLGVECRAAQRYRAERGRHRCPKDPGFREESGIASGVRRWGVLVHDWARVCRSLRRHLPQPRCRQLKDEAFAGDGCGPYRSDLVSQGVASLGYPPRGAR